MLKKFFLLLSVILCFGGVGYGEGRENIPVQTKNRVMQYQKEFVYRVLSQYEFLLKEGASLSPKEAKYIADFDKDPQPGDLVLVHMDSDEFLVARVFKKDPEEKSEDPVEKAAIAAGFVSAAAHIFAGALALALIL